jgi:hypothetical protein
VPDVADRVEPERRVRVAAADRTPGPTGLSALADDVEMSRPRPCST